MGRVSSIVSRSQVSDPHRSSGIAWVHVNGHSVITPQPFGESNVIGIAVCQDDAFDVIECLPSRSEFSEQFTPMTGEACVDDSHPLASDDEVGGHYVVAYAVEGIVKLHDGYSK